MKTGKRKNYKYFSNCVHLAVEDLHEMEDLSIDITWQTFSKYVSVDHLRGLHPFCTYSYRGEHTNPKTGEQTSGLNLKDDYSVSFHRSFFKGVRCYYIQHSRIEYIFLPHG